MKLYKAFDRIAEIQMLLDGSRKMQDELDRQSSKISLIEHHMQGDAQRALDALQDTLNEFLIGPLTHDSWKLIAEKHRSVIVACADHLTSD